MLSLTFPYSLRSNFSDIVFILWSAAASLLKMFHQCEFIHQHRVIIFDKKKKKKKKLARIQTWFRRKIRTLCIRTMIHRSLVPGLHSRVFYWETRKTVVIRDRLSCDITSRLYNLSVTLDVDDCSVILRPSPTLTRSLLVSL